MIFDNRIWCGRVRLANVVDILSYTWRARSAGSTFSSLCCRRIGGNPFLPEILIGIIGCDKKETLLKCSSISNYQFPPLFKTKKYRIDLCLIMDDEYLTDFDSQCPTVGLDVLHQKKDLSQVGGQCCAMLYDIAPPPPTETTQKRPKVFL